MALFPLFFPANLKGIYLYVAQGVQRVCILISSVV
jgi:hypothetical protein